VFEGGTFHPDYSSECRLCETSPCVIVYDPESRHNHDTLLCGYHFFQDRLMIHPEYWNDKREESE
jgi:hypothetical protein